MWPFRSKPTGPTYAEDVAAAPEPPCGEKAEHYRWRFIESMPCPMCAGIKRRSEELEAENRLAKKIAAVVINRMADKTPGNEAAAHGEARLDEMPASLAPREIRLGDCFSNLATGDRFVCSAITRRDNGAGLSNLTIEVVRAPKDGAES